MQVFLKADVSIVAAHELITNHNEQAGARMRQGARPGWYVSSGLHARPSSRGADSCSPAPSFAPHPS